jgi:hypothetical protein
MAEPEPVTLQFSPEGEGEEFAADLSAVAQVGDDLWVGTDEGTSLARLSRREPSVYAGHTDFPLGRCLELPGGDDEEIDVEGLAAADGYLWLVGSHSPRRRDTDSDDPSRDPVRQLQRLGRVKRGGNRYLLARVPLATERTGSVLRASTDDGRHAARLPGGRRRNALTDLLADDEHLRRFLRIPGKDNGFNIEGMAVADQRVFLGLRGPVLRGWAVILVVAPRPEPDDPGTLRLGRLEGKRRYHKLFLDLHGLGIRDLHADGPDLLILAGPTMSLDSDAVVLRWRDAFGAQGDTLVPRDRFERVLDLPYGAGSTESIDHPEGIALLREGEDKSLLVVYDSPAPARRRGKSAVLADRYRL